MIGLWWKEGFLVIDGLCHLFNLKDGRSEFRWLRIALPARRPGIDSGVGF